MRHSPRLPIEQVLPALRDALRSGRGAVLQAPPGAGKTTGVPLALLDEPWLQGRGIVMLEPRRLAARAAARRMATLLGEGLGQTVGYRIRHESAIGPTTRVLVVTEGVLTRMLQSDPALERFGLVIFDEFHERSIHADLGLALTLHSRSFLREDLRILVMSATLEGAPVSALLGGAPMVTSEGRSHPVEVRHRSRRSGSRLEADVAAVTREALDAEEGDVLVFLPGAGEIRRVAALLGGVAADVIPLHGSLPPEQQDRAILPEPAGPTERWCWPPPSPRRASRSREYASWWTAGLSRVPRYSPRTGMTRLATVRVSAASADQRRGRAGRLAPGVCYRLWSAQEHAALPARSTPEILEADLAPLALELAAAGAADPAELEWLDPPPAAAFAQARGLLIQLGALDAAGRITRHGRRWRGSRSHPRLAHMVMRATELRREGFGLRAGRAPHGARPPASNGGCPRGGHPDAPRPPSGDRRASRGGSRSPAAGPSGSCGMPARVRAGREEGESGSVWAALLALAYPDRIAQRRPGAAGRFLLRNGLGAFLDPQSLSGEEYLVACELDGRAPESRILQAAPIDLAEIRGLFGPRYRGGGGGGVGAGGSGGAGSTEGTAGRHRAPRDEDRPTRPCQGGGGAAPGCAR